jgi:hypothetical protein
LADDTSAAMPAAEVPELGVVDEVTTKTLSAYRQADVLAGLDSVTVVGPDGSQVPVPAPLGVVLVSQTCDVVLAGRPAVQVARRIRLSADEARDARDGKRPRYAHLPQIGDRDFADLDVIGTVAKGQVAASARTPGVAGDEEVRRFAGAVARKFGRFAFPDEIAPWLRPLEEVVASKTRRPNSPEGKALAEVVELRVEAANGWGSGPYELTLCVIVQPGTLPTFPNDDIPGLPTGLNAWLYGADGELRRSSGEIAARLEDATEPADRHWLWMALGEAWEKKCRPGSNACEGVRSAVADLVAEVVPADEFPLTRVRRSEILDLDHLSGPTPDL